MIRALVTCVSPACGNRVHAGGIQVRPTTSYRRPQRRGGVIQWAIQGGCRTDAGPAGWAGGPTPSLGAAHLLHISYFAKSIVSSARMSRFSSLL